MSTLFYVNFIVSFFHETPADCQADPQFSLFHSGKHAGRVWSFNRQTGIFCLGVGLQILRI